MRKENFNKGWISIYRSLFNHWLAPKGKPFTRLEAWLFILVDVNHTERKVLIGQQLILCKRGESLNSLDTWSRYFNWDKSKVRRFFNLLEKDNMIERKTNHNTTHIIVCNYDSYQDSRHSEETEMKHDRNANETSLTPNNNVNNLIIKKSLIYNEILNSQIYFETLQKTHSLKENELKEMFKNFWNLNYQENNDYFNATDVKKYFINKLNFNKKPAAKKPAAKRVINRD